MNKIEENNRAVLRGEIVEDFRFEYERYGEKFYTAGLAAGRLSGVKDIIRVTASDRLVPVEEDWTGQTVAVFGEFRSYNKRDGGKNSRGLSVFAKSLDVLEEIGCEKNSTVLDGYICKQPAFRKTPLGREIADILLAVNRSYGKSDYIPCIAWSRNARFAENLEVGTRLRIEGRIQSREYQKRISDEECETRVVYEVSISKMETVEEMEEQK